jgi:hypothetical protein
MGIMVSESSGATFEPLSQGVHNAVCFAMYDLGTQHTEYKGEQKLAHQVLIMWEIPAERIEIEKNGQKVDMPRAISKKYTMSLGEKANLRRDLQGWRGRQFTPEELATFDITTIIGLPCMIQVLHKISKKTGKPYANIAAIMPLMKGAPSIKAENPLRFYSISDHKDQIPEGTPKWIAETIKESDEWKIFAKPEEEPPPFAFEGEIPPESDEVPFL